MNVRISELKKLSLAVCLAISPLSLNAAGLGKLNVTSSLGEPFRAEIDLISTTPDELETLTAVIASQQAYESQGITRLGIHKDMRVQIANNGSKPKLLLSSNKAVSDPYLDMLIQLDWASGRLQREYTVLLDPPGYKQTVAENNVQPVVPPVVNVPQPQAVERRAVESIENATPLAVPALPTESVVEAQPTVMPTTRGTQSVPTLLPVPNSIEQYETNNVVKKQTSPVTAPSVRSQQINGTKTEAEIAAEIANIEARAKASAGVVMPAVKPVVNTVPSVDYKQFFEDEPTTEARTVSGDTLSGIAQSMRVPGVSLNQMLVGLYEYNKQAFVDGNMNRLKVGKVINLPTESQLRAVSRAEANKTVVLHTDNWRGYRNSVASSITESTHADNDTQKQSDSGVITKVEPETAPAPKEDKDVVKLSAGEKNQAGADSESAKAAVEEDKIASEKALAEAKDRTASVEQQIEDMQKLLAMKNEAMKGLQDKSAEDNANKDIVKEVEQKVEAAIEATNAEVAAAEAKAESEAATPVADEADKPKPQEAKKPTDKPAVAETEPDTEEVSFLDKIKDMLGLPVLGGLGAILLLLGGWLFLRNKRKKDLESFERGILTSGGLRANTVFGNTTGDTSSTDTSFLTDFAQTTEGAVMDANEVDPIAEAEVYMAYGREEQAEEILKDAIKKEPKRYELHLKLLEIYKERKDTAAFETLASELYTSLGAADPTWQQIAAMGRDLEPANPLYALQAGAAATATAPITTSETPTVNTESDLNAEEATEVPVLDSVITPVTTTVEAAKEGVDKVATNTGDAIGDVASSVGDKFVSAKDAVANVTENVTGAVVDTAGDVKDAAAGGIKSAGVKTAAVAGVAAAAATKGVSRIESIVRHKPENEAEALAKQADDAIADASSKVEEVAEDISTDNRIEITEIEDLEADMAIELSGDNTVASAEDAVPEDPKAFDLSGISLEMDEGAQAETEVVADAPPAPDLTFDTEEEAASSEAVEMQAPAVGDDNEVEIKLNLVAAYIDMDDKEGARELLDEVLNEGNDDQKMRAQMMLDSIA